MITPTDPKPVKLFFTILRAPKTSVEILEERLANEFGAIDARSPDSDAAHCAIYDKEMGLNLIHRMIAVSELASPDELPGIKRHVHKIEQYFSQPGGGRLFNIDPGWLDSNRVGLMTFRDAAYRIYLGQGVFGEIAMTYGADFQFEGYRAWPWTYPDFQTPLAREFFAEMRKTYRLQAMQELGK